MPLPLHPNLKRGLQLEEHTTNSQDSIEPPPRTYASAEGQDAKRRRVEKIASEYLRGKRPVILSAGLRGPFNRGWKNPWEQTEETHEKAVGKEDGMKGHKIRLRRRSATQAVMSRNGSTTAQKTMLHSLTSPTISRAAQHDLEAREKSELLHDTQDLPPTIPPPAESDATSATTFFGADPGLRIQHRSSVTDYFWLQRPKTSANFDPHAATSHASDSSPIRTRKARPISTTTESRKAAPVEPLNRTLRDETRASEELRSGPSSTTALTSTKEAVSGASKAVQATTNSSINSSTDRSSTQIHASHPSLLEISEQRTETLRDASSKSLACMPSQSMVPDRPTATDLTSTVPLDPAVRPYSDSGLEQVSHPSKERPASSDPNSTTSTISHIQQTIQPTRRQAWQPPQQTLIASPAPNSSTGFKYKKLAPSKWSISNAPRSKPRAVNFNSSPASALVHTNTNNLENSDSQEQFGKEGCLMDKAERTQSQNASRQAEHQDEDSMTIQGSRTKSQAEFSTQAAMLLAQLEFHENTIPQSLVGTPRLPGPLHNISSHNIMSNESTTMTPHSFLRPEARPPQHRNSMTQSASMSTQDLFAAASPFAYSTVKKTVASQRIIRDNLTPCGKECINISSPGSTTTTGEQDPKGQMTLTATPWSFAFSDDSPNSGSIPRCTAGATPSNDSLAHLKDHTSRNDLGHKEAVETTDDSLYSYYGP